MPLSPRLVAAVEAWCARESDAGARAELEALVAAGDEAELRDRFDGELTFGTAGIRGRLGAGPNRMNHRVVAQVAAGLARWLGPGRRVVVGRDARYRSDEFASVLAATLAAGGLDVVLLDGPRPTPVLAFAVRHLGADAGVMVTASHNPRWDNGLKVYGGDGAQLVPPDDASLMAAVRVAADDRAAPDGATVTHPGAITTADVDAAYLAGAVAGCPAGPREVRLAHTALHGVGGRLVTEALVGAGFPAPAVVDEQAEPDPAFPTVTYPNPEEPGVLDRLLALAEARGADVALASDPDADRLGVAYAGSDGRWRILTGDEVGALLADHLLRQGSGPDRLVVSTFVSSPLVGRIAEAAGVHHARTITGFKWLVRPALAHPEWRFVFAYEEALGYAVGDLVRDKDGITAALAVASLAAELRATGATLGDRLDDLARQHGLHASHTWSVRDDEPGGRERLRARYEALRAAPPTTVAGVRVGGVVDHGPGAEGLPPTDALRLDLVDGRRIIVRPSGTEPKVKAYLHAVVPVGPGPEAVAGARAEGDALLRALAQAMSDIFGGPGPTGADRAV